MLPLLLLLLARLALTSDLLLLGRLGLLRTCVACLLSVWAGGRLGLGVSEGRVQLRMGTGWARAACRGSHWLKVSQRWGP